MDPLAENHHSVTPYNYVLNNPINTIDPFGLDTVPVNKLITNNPNAKQFDPAKDEIALNPNAVVISTPRKNSTTEAGLGEAPGSLQAAIPVALTASAIDGPLPIGDVIGAGVVTAAAVRDLTQIKFITYTLTNPLEGKTYIGRSSGYGDPYSIMMNRYSGHHMRQFGYSSPQLDRVSQGFPLGYYAIRGREQDAVDAYGGIGSPFLGNRLNPIYKYNPNRPAYKAASSLMFGPYFR